MMLKNITDSQRLTQGYENTNYKLFFKTASYNEAALQFSGILSLLSPSQYSVEVFVTPLISFVTFTILSRDFRQASYLTVCVKIHFILDPF